jgi:hypothetical protein
MRYILIYLCLSFLPLSGCAFSTAPEHIADQAQAEEWADDVKNEDVMRPQCSFKTDGIGGCSHQ